MSEQSLAILDGGAVARRPAGSVASFQPANVDELMRFVAGIADSDLVPKEMRGRTGNIILAIQMGAELGMKPMQALQSIAVINGRPCLWGDGLLGLVQASGLLEDFEEQIECDDKGNVVAAACMVKRVGRSREKMVVFTVEDAKKAGLWAKTGPWQQYPKRMLQLRARSFAIRDEFADVLKGMRTAEEALDMVIDADPVAPSHSTTTDKASAVRDRMREQMSRQATQTAQARPGQTASQPGTAGSRTAAGTVNESGAQCPVCNAPDGKKHAAKCTATLPAEPSPTPLQLWQRAYESSGLATRGITQTKALADILGREVAVNTPPTDAEFTAAHDGLGTYLESLEQAAPPADDEGHGEPED